MENTPDCFKNFTGSIDDLLNHVDKLDPNQVEEALSDNVPLSDDEHLDTLMEEFHCSREEAQGILQAIKEDHVKEMCEKMVEEGILEVSYDADGEPMYQQTEFGRKVMEEEKRLRGLE